MERTDLQDTTIEAHRIYTRMLREKGPEWRIQRTLEMIQASIDMFPEQTRRAIRQSPKRETPLSTANKASSDFGFLAENAEDAETAETLGVAESAAHSK